jgi:hypothetical protein
MSKHQHELERRPIKTSKGHMYHGDPVAVQNQRLRQELNEAKKENERLQRLLDQHNINEADVVLRDLKQCLDALWNVALCGWPHKGMALVDKRHGKKGDAEAYDKLQEVMESLRAVVIDVSGVEGTNQVGWLGRREAIVINLGKGLVNV